MSQQLRRILFCLAFLIPFLIWPFCRIDLNKDFQFEVPTLIEVSLFENQCYYLYIHLFSIVPVFLLSFDEKVGFYKSWKKLFPAILLIGFIFIVWDVLFTAWNVWGFNDSYFLGVEFLGLPLEELLFFVSIPFALSLIHISEPTRPY